MAISSGSTRARKKFLRYFPKGFRDETYIDWERGYKWNAHEQWMTVLAAREFKALLAQKKFAEIAAHAVRIESRTNLLFSFEKMALRDAVKSPEGAREFATDLYKFLHGRGSEAVVHLGRASAAAPDARVDVAFGHDLGIHRATGTPLFP